MIDGSSTKSHVYINAIPVHMLTELSTANSRSFHTIFHKTYSLLQTRKITPHASKSWNHFHNIVDAPEGKFKTS